ncbi:ComEC/Rec2 family competence protein [Ferrovibrio sp.]|uniref:ComEC/Rec2 family competence protein n=1 Tax=Ferrovibrio sp. TaxID=1917215 RepID=UPI0035119CE7
MTTTFHFLNVGHGDCTIIEHDDGQYTIVDINNGSDLNWNSRFEIAASMGVLSALELLVFRSANIAPPSYSQLEQAGYHVRLTNPVDYILRTFKGKRPWRFILTHPDFDHMRGLAALIQQGLAPHNFWDLPHDKEIAENLQDWDEPDFLAYQRLARGDFGNVLQPMRGSYGYRFNRDIDGLAGGHGIEILSPSRKLVDQCNEYGDWNDLSYVLKVTDHGLTAILGGDAEDVAWDSIVRAHRPADLKCDLLKASHHGRRSGFYEPALALMRPQMTVVSVGKKPNTDGSHKYRRYTKNELVLSTRWNGNITATFAQDSFKYWREYEH